MVVTARPCACAARVRQASTRWPSIATVHAPHWPWSQPFLAPTSRSSSRNAFSGVVRASSYTRCSLQFTRSVSGSTAEGGSDAADSGGKATSR